MEERTGCIYCFSTKQPTGVEHVVSKAIGVFEQNWTIDSVCDNCNAYFSKTHDLTLGRDSAEGVLRVIAGVKPAGTIDDFRNRSVTFSLDQSGPLRGALLRMRPSAHELVPTPTPQVAFRCEGSDWHYVLERDLNPETVAKLTGANVEIRILGVNADGDLERLREKLLALGIEFAERGRLMDQPLAPDGEPVSVLHTFNITDAHRGAAAKICFNYLAKVMGRSFAQRPEFDVIRRFIRYGEGNGFQLVSVQRQSVLVGEGAKTSRAHGVGFEWMPQRQELVGIATFFNEMTYGVRLGHNPTDEWAALSSLHFFDATTREIRPAGKGM
jgi:hypothetical protein